MQTKDHHITAEEAKAALESIETANKITLNSIKPPIGLVLLGSVALGIKTTAMGVMFDGNVWNVIQWGAYITICLSLVVWLVVLWIKGIRVKIVGVNLGKTGIVAALLICTLLASSRGLFLLTNSMVFPGIAGLLNALILAFSLQAGLRFNVRQAEAKSD